MNSTETTTKTFVKVFGERNTGTNWLCQILKANTNLTVLGDGGKPNFKPRLTHLLNSYEISDKLALKLIKEKLLDADRNQQYPLYFGWKHSAVDCLRISSAERFPKTLFLCIIRNPWRFVSGLHKRPYNVIPLPVADISDFISSPLVLNQRDGISDLYVSNPVELWNKKVASYYNFRKNFPGSVRIFKYEDIVVDPSIVREQIAEFSQFKSADILIPEVSTKFHRGDSKTYNDYKKEVVAYDPCESMGKEIAQKIFMLTDRDLMSETGYDSLYR